MNVILFGFKGCGKTTLGKQVAKRLGRPFLDTDRLVEKLYFEQTGLNLSYREIFKRIGEKNFRSLESQALPELQKKKNTMIALGGGFILNPHHASALAKLGQLVYLKVDKETLKKRILSGEIPAYFDPADPEKSFERIYEERKTYYEKILALSFNVETQTEDQAAEKLCAWILKEENTHEQ